MIRLFWLIVLTLVAGSARLGAEPASLSPAAIIANHDGTKLFIACGGAGRVLCYDPARQKIVNTVALPASPSGLALSADDGTLYVTCAAPESRVCLIDTGKLVVKDTIIAGHTAVSPVLSPDGKTLYVCNQFDNDVSVIDLGARKETCRLGVQREPVAAGITRDGRYLLVANQLSRERADSKTVSASVSVLDLAAGREVNTLALPVGSEMLKDLRVSPDGKYAVVTHIFCNYDLPTRRVELGLINANAMTIINLANLEPECTCLLDEPYRGAGNPWGMSFSADGSTLAVAHAGAREVSVIDFPALLAGLPDTSHKSAWPTNLSTPVLKFVPHYEDEELNDGLPFLVGARHRVKLPADCLGPRAVVLSGHTIYTANYFSDNLSVIDLSEPRLQALALPLGKPAKMTPARWGEFYFHDADLCFQGWQSCSSCHPGGGRVDALNWDLASQGPGHPKNTRSVLLAAQTESQPATQNGAGRMGATLDDAVRVAIKTLLFTNAPDEVAQAMEAYIKSLKPVPSPNLVQGQLSPSAKRGGLVFTQAGCARCHAPGLYTDRLAHNVGTVTRYDTSPQFPTPSLVEAWRTAPYLHDGSAPAIRDVLTTRNPNDGRHGDVAGLTRQQLDDLCAYVLSL